MLVWIDLETTGLVADVHDILEIGIVVTDDHLEPIASFWCIVKQDIEFARPNMAEIVVEMHTKNGLLEEITNGDCVDEQEAVDRAMLFLRKHVEEKKAPAAGSTVSFDRSFLKRHMPEIDQYLHYRSVDVSSVKELCRRWRPDIYEKLPPGQKKHRVIPDIQDSIGELKFYREHFLRGVEV